MLEENSVKDVEDVVRRFGAKTVGANPPSEKEKPQKNSAREKKKIAHDVIAYDGSTPLKSIMQEMFVSNLFRGMSLAKAYRQAGYNNQQPTSGAIQLTKNNRVLTRLAYKRGELAQKLGISEQRVVEELAKLAFANMQDFVSNSDGEFIFKNWDGLSRDQLAAVESVKVTTTTTKNASGEREYETKNVTFKLHNKPQVLEQLGRHLGLFERDNEQKRETLSAIMVLAGSIHKEGVPK